VRRILGSCLGSVNAAFCKRCIFYSYCLKIESAVVGDPW